MVITGSIVHRSTRNSYLHEHHDCVDAAFKDGYETGYRNAILNSTASCENMDVVKKDVKKVSKKKSK